MRLFLYLLALVAGLSPAEASRVAVSEPVAVGAVSHASAPQRATDISAALHHDHLRQKSIAPASLFAASLPALGASLRIFLTDRPRA